jgi:hypothetical protein
MCGSFFFLFLFDHIAVSLTIDRLIMPSKHLYPDLSIDGWINEPLKVANKLLLDFFTSLHSQSNLFMNNINSYNQLMYQYGDRPQDLADNTKSVLSKYFSDMFDSVEVVTSIIASDTVTKQITIALKFSDSSGQVYDVTKLFEMSNLTVNKVIDLKTNS